MRFYLIYLFLTQNWLNNARCEEWLMSTQPRGDVFTKWVEWWSNWLIAVALRCYNIEYEPLSRRLGKTAVSLNCALCLTNKHRTCLFLTQFSLFLNISQISSCRNCCSISDMILLVLKSRIKILTHDVDLGSLKFIPFQVWRMVSIPCLSWSQN